ncbi:hypothetical protein EVJ50_00740 [Synechococcus sp. RSCCF101]|uniref:hypothetical protein n=1 Tax=Synechococcus sp. RSCCF101 TaxID=2511069 RepID=UPI0012460904|nr:hypothetical protein [Synechococcus sp. RSCCF101]QEY30997.1 hypothetical protein EVJ50_00740 [Synechococcus sp. RSCCF101]
MPPIRALHPPHAAVMLPCLAAALALGSGLSRPSAAAEALYELETSCSLAGADPVACTVLASDDGDSTRYEHRLGNGTSVLTLRISEDPVVRMERLDASGDNWSALSNAAARFSTNTVCFEGREVCVVNANYLNSIKEERGAALDGRDLVMVRFGADGRVNASCYDEGCEALTR